MNWPAFEGSGVFAVAGDGEGAVVAAVSEAALIGRTLRLDDIDLTSQV